MMEVTEMRVKFPVRRAHALQMPGKKANSESCRSIS